MLTLLVVVITLLAYLRIVQNKLQGETEKEKKWVYMYAAFAAGMAILNFLPVPLSFPLKWLNHTLGEFTKYVIHV